VSNATLVVLAAAFVGVLATTRLDCVKNENSGLTLCEGCFNAPADEVVVTAGLLLLDGKLIAGVAEELGTALGGCVVVGLLEMEKQSGKTEQETS
jgi:hypothetical protein